MNELSDDQIKDLKGFIAEKFNRTDVDFEYKKEPELIGGFILNVGDYEYDKSYRTSLKSMHDNLKSKAKV